MKVQCAARWNISQFLLFYDAQIIFKFLSHKMQVLDVSCGDISLTVLTHHQSNCSDLSSVIVRIMFVILQLSSFMTFTVHTKVWRQFQAETKNDGVGCLYTAIDVIHLHTYMIYVYTVYYALGPHCRLVLFRRCGCDQ